MSLAEVEFQVFRLLGTSMAERVATHAGAAWLSGHARMGSRGHKLLRRISIASCGGVILWATPLSLILYAGFESVKFGRTKENVIWTDEMTSFRRP